MQEEDFPAADKIISLIEAAFRRDPELSTFDVVLSPADDNTCPVIHVVAEHCLGVKSWCVKPLYQVVYRRLLRARDEHLHKRHTLSPEERQRLESLLNTSLLLHPEVAAFWNMRRELVTRGHLRHRQELSFATLVSSFRPKVSDVFVYRRWVLTSLLESSEEEYKSAFGSEFAAVYRAASQYANNYNAWSHALWCLERAPLELYDVLRLSSANWMAKHVSDHSGMQFRQQVILRTLDWCQGVSCSLCPAWYIQYKQDNCEENKFTNHFMHELVKHLELIKSYPGHEALWYHRRFLVHGLLVRCDPSLRPALRDQEAATNVSSDDAPYLAKHLRWMDRVLSGSADPSSSTGPQ